MEGGSANDYDYCSGDPVNCNDLGGTKQRPLRPDEVLQVAKIAGECSSGADAYYSSSSFCMGFLKSLSKGDLTDYGFGFVPNTRRKYVKCPSWVEGGSSFLGYGGYARAALQAGAGDGEGALRTARDTTIFSDFEDQIGKNLVKQGVRSGAKIAWGVGVGATAIDAVCTNI